MLLENYIKLLLEAPQAKLGDLKKHPGKVLVGKNYQSYFDFANQEFKTFNENEGLDKRGPFFNCINMCFNEFISYENDPEIDIAENIRSMVVYINGLYNYKNNANVSKVYTTLITDGYAGFDKLRDAYNSVFEHIGAKNLNNFNNKNFSNMLKTTQTEYLFDTPNKTMNGLLAVVPTTTASSIFWSRTNADAQKIVLEKVPVNAEEHNDPTVLNWCTSFPNQENMFHSYFVYGGMSLFYFLPVNDIEGRNKFCIGVTKIKNSDDPDDFKLLCGGHTVVGFENKKFIEEGSDFTDKEVKGIILNKFGRLGLTEEMLDIIQEKVSGRNPFDKYAYIGNLSPAEFAASINMNTIGSTEMGRDAIKKQIESVFKIYKDPEFLKDYTPNPNLIKVVSKDIRYWTDCRVSLNYLPESLANRQDFWVNNTIASTNLSNNDSRQDVTTKSIENFIDFNFKKNPNIVTANFIINFLENCFDKAMQKQDYSDDDVSARIKDFDSNLASQKDTEADIEAERYVQYAKKEEEFHFSTYDQICFNLQFSIVPVEALMTWQSSDIIKFFDYITKVSNNYNYSDLYEKYSGGEESMSAEKYFIRHLSKKEGFRLGGYLDYTEDMSDEEYDEMRNESRGQKYSDEEFRNCKIFCSQLLKTLFNDFNSFKYFVFDKGFDYTLPIQDVLLYDNSDIDQSEPPFLIPKEWVNSSTIDYLLGLDDQKKIEVKIQLQSIPKGIDVVLDILKNKSMIIKTNDINQFKKENLKIVGRAISFFLRMKIGHIIYVLTRIHKTEDISNIESEDIKKTLKSKNLFKNIDSVEKILNTHDDIIQELQKTDLNDENSHFSIFTREYEKIKNAINKNEKIEESIKFKIGNKILSERQFRKLISYLL